MEVRSGQSITTIFSTSVFSTGALGDATGTPAGTLYLNGTANGATVTVTNITTGQYKAAVTLPTLAVGDVVSIFITATVSGVAGGGKVWEGSKSVFAGALPDVIAGGSGGLFISGSNTGTTTYGALTVTGATTLTGNVSLGGTLGVTGTTTFAAVNTGTIGTGNVTITGTLSTSGTVTLNALTVSNTLTVTGATTLTGAVTASNASNSIAVDVTKIAGAAVELADFVDANVISINSITLDGAGTALNPWGPA